MCGLCGIVGKLEFADESAIKTMMLLNYFRGEHSTGFAAVRNNGDVKIAKQLGGPWDLWEYPRFKDALNGNQSCVFMAHARQATRGEIKTVNAHPFHFGHIVGAHNGTLDHSCVHELKDLLGDEYPVDSMYIFSAIAEIGIKETIPLLRGSWALAYTDLKEGTFNLITNGDRPLCYATTKDQKNIFYASTWPMIAAGLAKTGDKNEYKEIARDGEGNRFFSVPKDFLFSWDIAELQKGKAKPVCTKLEGKEPFLANSSNVGVHRGGNKSDPFRRVEPTTPHGSVTTTSKASGHKPIDNILIDVEGSETNPYPGFTRQEFEDWTQDGCQFCGTPIPWGSKGITIYERQQVVLCNKHSARVPDDKVRIYVKEITQEMKQPVAA
jgi:predicted glutamine amidotransferase